MQIEIPLLALKFSELHQGIDCNCLEGAISDNQNLFARRVNLKSPFKNQDFKYSMNKRPDADNCIEWCKVRGISTHIYNTESKLHVIEKNLFYLGIARGSKKQLSIFKIKNDGGMVKHTPEQGNGEIDRYHYDFYKPDGFEVDKHLELVELLTYEELRGKQNV